MSEAEGFDAADFNETETHNVIYVDVRAVLIQTDERGLSRVVIEQASGTTDIDVRANNLTVTAGTTVRDAVGGAVIASDNPHTPVPVLAADRSE